MWHPISMSAADFVKLVATCSACALLSTRLDLQIRQALSKFGAGAAEFAVVDHGVRCPKNSSNELVLPNQAVWTKDLWSMLVTAALKQQGPTGVRFIIVNPNRQKLWAIPLLIAAQVGGKLLFDRMCLDDDCTGDNFGPFRKSYTQCASCRSCFISLIVCIYSLPDGLEMALCLLHTCH